MGRACGDVDTNAQVGGHGGVVDSTNAHNDGCARGGSDACLIRRGLQRLPGALQQQALLRVHVHRLRPANQIIYRDTYSRF